MLANLFNAFVRVTAYPVQLPIFRTKVYYEDRRVQSRRIKGGAIVICNHTSVWDYAALMFVFFFRTLRAQMAEVLFEKQPLGLFLKMMGGVRVDRNVYDFGFVSQSQRILEKGGVVEIFPLGLLSGAPMIPVFTNGAYFSKKRARVIIGKPLYARALTDDSLSEKENIARVSEALREKIISLEKQLYEQSKEG